MITHTFFKNEISFGVLNLGNINHSQASIEKAKLLLGYNPKYSAVEGFEKACEWYFKNLQ